MTDATGRQLQQHAWLLRGLVVIVVLLIGVGALLFNYLDGRAAVGQQTRAAVCAALNGIPRNDRRAPPAERRGLQAAYKDLDCKRLPPAPLPTVTRRVSPTIPPQTTPRPPPAPALTVTVTPAASSPVHPTQPRTRPSHAPSSRPHPSPHRSHHPAPSPSPTVTPSPSRTCLLHLICRP